MRRLLKILLAADFFMLLAMGMLVPIYAIFVEQIGGDILDASGAWAAFALSAGILMYVIARWEDKKKHYKKMLLTGYILRSIGFLGYFFVSNTNELFAVQILLGISFAITDPSFDALYSKNLDKGHWATDWAIWEGMDMTVAALAAIIGGLIAKFYGFKPLFILMFLSGIIGVIIALTIIKKK